jgi:hypothetical protein
MWPNGSERRAARWMAFTTLALFGAVAMLHVLSP